jgi:hypothetical protein
LIKRLESGFQEAVGLIYTLYIFKLPRPFQDCLMDLLPFIFGETVKWIIHTKIKDHGLNLRDIKTDQLLG